MSIELKLTTEVLNLWDAITSGRVSYLSYSALQAAIARPFGSIAEISGDAGTHTDPVSALVVVNNGVYRRVEAGWQRLSDLPADVLNASAALRTDLAAAGGSALVNQLPAGVTGLGVVDESIPMQARYDALAAAGGGVLEIPTGTYRLALNMTSRNVMIRGAGRGRTILKPVVAAGVVLRALYRQGGWNRVTVERLSLEGVGANQGIGFQAGADVYADNDEYNGLTLFRDVSFNNFDRCINRPYGSLGLWLDFCQFSAANFHIHSRGVTTAQYAAGGGNDLMHPGIIVSRGVHYQQAAKASWFIDSVTLDSGQVKSDSDVFEANPGYVLYVKNFTSGGSIPGIVFDNTWFEANNTAAALAVDGEAAVLPVSVHLNSSAALFRDTPIGSTRLTNARLQTRDSNLTSFTVTKDAASTVSHDSPRVFTGTLPGLCSRIAVPAGLTGLATPWHQMDLPRGLTKAWNANLLYRVDGSAVINYVGTVSRSSVAGAANDYALPGATTSQNFTFNTGETEFNGSFTIPTLKYIVHLQLTRIISGGPVNVNSYPSGFGGAFQVNNAKWAMFANITYNSGTALAGQAYSYVSAVTNAQIGVGGVAILSFDTLQEALDCVNSGMFPA